MKRWLVTSGSRQGGGLGARLTLPPETTRKRQDVYNTGFQGTTSEEGSQHRGLLRNGELTAAAVPRPPAGKGGHSRADVLSRAPGCEDRGLWGSQDGGKPAVCTQERRALQGLPRVLRARCSEGRREEASGPRGSASQRMKRKPVTTHSVLWPGTPQPSLCLADDSGPTSSVTSPPPLPQPPGELSVPPIYQRSGQGTGHLHHDPSRHCEDARGHGRCSILGPRLGTR